VCCLRVCGPGRIVLRLYFAQVHMRLLKNYRLGDRLSVERNQQRAHYREHDDRNDRGQGRDDLASLHLKTCSGSFAVTVIIMTEWGGCFYGGVESGDVV